MALVACCGGGGGWVFEVVLSGVLERALDRAARVAALVVHNTSACRCFGSLWQLSRFLVDGLRSQVLAVNGLRVFLKRKD